MRLNDISGAVIRCAMKVHSRLGPGLLESAYEACLAYELRREGYMAEVQVGLPLVYDGIKLDLGYRIDLLVNDAVVVELKSIDAVLPVHQAQLLSYLRLSSCKVGLLINFNVVHLRDGIKRMVNHYEDSPADRSESSASSAVKGFSGTCP